MAFQFRFVFCFVFTFLGVYENFINRKELLKVKLIFLNALEDFYNFLILDEQEMKV